MSDVENEARRAKRRLGLWIALGAICLAVVLVLVSNLWVFRVARGHLFDEPGAAPEAAAALVLGCSKTIAGRPNRFFDERIAAARPRVWLRTAVGTSDYRVRRGIRQQPVLASGVHRTAADQAPVASSRRRRRRSASSSAAAEAENTE